MGTNHKELTQGEPDFSRVEFTVIAINSGRKHLLNQVVADSPSQAIQRTLELNEEHLSYEQTRARDNCDSYEVLSHYSKAEIEKTGFDRV